ncbi:MAG: hypothetical protein ACXWPM_06295 [Bdellovibrionota bacterium]
MKSLFLILLFASSSGFAAENTSFTASKPASSEGPGQLFTVQAGPYQPAGINITNGNYAFTYKGDSLNSFMVQVGWAARLFHLLGEVSIEESLGYSNFSGIASASNLPNSQGQSLSVNVLSLDSRIMHSWDWFPWKPLVPFVDGGYQFAFYHQGGPSDLESAQGTVGNFVAGGGLRFWVNYWRSLSTDHVSRYTEMPVYLTARVTRIFSSGSSIDLSSTVFMGGLSIGI